MVFVQQQNSLRLGPSPNKPQRGLLELGPTWASQLARGELARGELARRSHLRGLCGHRASAWPRRLDADVASGPVSEDADVPKISRCRQTT